jgi:hypothetical protein
MIKDSIATAHNSMNALQEAFNDKSLVQDCHFEDCQILMSMTFICTET